MKLPKNQAQKRLFVTIPQSLGLLYLSTSANLMLECRQGHGRNPSAVSMHTLLSQGTSVKGSDWCPPKSYQPQSAWNEDANLCNGRGGVLLSFSPACTTPLARPQSSAWWPWHTTALCCWAAAQTLKSRSCFLPKNLRSCMSVSLSKHVIT